MVITFLTIYNRNLFFTKHMANKINLNLSILLAKNNYKNTMLKYNKNHHEQEYHADVQEKIIMNLIIYNL